MPPLIQDGSINMNIRKDKVSNVQNITNIQKIQEFITKLGKKSSVMFGDGKRTNSLF